jgi:hypothetical protein
VLLFISEQTSIHISQLATAAYVALPECILGLAFVTLISHIRVWLYNRSLSAGIWMVLYGLPTVVFLVLSLITLGCSVASTSFQMPEPLIVIRALAGYMFAFTSLLHAQLGVPQECDRLQAKDTIIQEKVMNLATLGREKDEIIARLRQENTVNLAILGREKDGIIAELRSKAETMIAEMRKEKQSLQVTIESQNGEIEKQKGLLVESKTAQSELMKAVDKSEDAALQAYSEECLRWLKSGVKTASVEEIARYTGHSKRKIDSAINRGSLQTAPRNKELILMSSLLPWLKSVQPSSGKTTEEVPVLHLVVEEQESVSA